MNELNILEIFGKNLHNIRLKKDISLQELSMMLNIDVKTLEKVETGESSALNIKQYAFTADKLHVSFEEITKGISYKQD